MKTGRLITAALSAALLALGGCNNYFHELMPPDENRIVLFELPGQLGPALITENSITVTVRKGTFAEPLLPNIAVSPKATLLPLTFEYLQAAFPHINIFKEAAAIYQTPDLSSYVMDLIRNEPDFNIPVLNIPIDFSGLVGFMVVSGQGTIRRYTVHAEEDDGRPRILSFGFAKYDNPELIRDALSTVDETARTVNVSVLYPMEIPLSYALIPSFEILGDRLEIDGAEVASREGVIQFAPQLGAQTKTLTVWREDISLDYTLTATFAEDPDSIRSITDFRFNRADNPGIAANAVGSIVNNDALGTITVQVFYAGARPSILTPRFISPGNVSVEGVTQTTGVFSHDFSPTVEYRVISRNNLYTRLYTVRVEFVDITAASPAITSFKFSSLINHELVQDTAAEISNAAGLIMITVKYGGARPPEFLIPEFSATGLVSVMGIIQSSGLSAQDFSRQIKYTVANPENPLLARDYWVQAVFERDTSSAAAINSFSFHPDDNPGLADELVGRIDQSAGTITINAPAGSGVSSRIMIPRFTAAGQVLVEAAVQASGASGQLFGAPVIYSAVSANGAMRRDYVVTVRELTGTIYVNHNAFGRGDGTDWQNAFRSLVQACEAAALFPGDTPKEIWIAAGSYAVDSGSFQITPNTAYIGGFAGNETAKSQRNVAANEVAVSSVGSGQTRLFAADDGIDGEILFENLHISQERYLYGYGIYVPSGSARLYISDCVFYSTFDAVSFKGMSAHISGSSFSACGQTLILDCTGETVLTQLIDEGSRDYSLILYGNGDKTLEALKISRGQRGIKIGNSSGNVEINGLELSDMNYDGISLGGSGTTYISSLEGRNISGKAISGSTGTGAFTLIDSNFDSAGSINVTSSSGSITARNIVIDGTTVLASPLSFTSSANGNITVDRVTLNRPSSGTAINMSSGGMVTVTDSAIRNNTNSGSRAAVYYSGTGSGTGNLQIDGLALHDIYGQGIYLPGSGANKYISGIEGWNISGDAVYLSSATSGSFTLEDSAFDSIGSIVINAGTGSSVDMTIRNTEIRNATGYSALETFNTGTGSTTMSGVTIDGVPNGRAVSARSNTVIYISDSSFRNCTSTASGGGILFTQSEMASAELTNVVIENVRTSSMGGGISATLRSLKISGSTIRNAQAGTSGGGIYIYFQALNVEITDTVIEDVEALSGSGGGIYSRSSDSVKISGSTIRNARAAGMLGQGGGITASSVNLLVVSDTTIKNAVATGAGGGILFSGSGRAEITRVVIEDVEASSGGGIYGTGSPLVVVSDTTIKNAVANGGSGNSGGGISGLMASLTINNSLFENCRAVNNGGAIGSSAACTITNTDFINCASLNGCKILGSTSIYSSAFRGCVFTDNAGLYNYGPPTSDNGYIYPMFDRREISFENCTFNNLRDNYPGENYIFNRWLEYEYPYSANGSIGILPTYTHRITLNNCTFNFNSGSAGLMALCESGQFTDGSWYNNDQLLMDNCKINNNGGQQPLFWFERQRPASTTGSFQFKANNVYNGATLDAAMITGMVTSGVVRLQGGAVPVIVP